MLTNSLRQAAHEFGKILVLIGGDKVHAGLDRRLPSSRHGLAGSEIVVIVPAAILRGSETVERIEADPVTELVRTVYQGAQTLAGGRRPVTGFVLSTFFDFKP